MDKKTLREQLKNNRASMEKSDIALKSNIITNKLLNLPQYKKAKVIMCYLAFKNEVITDGFIEVAIKDGKKIAVPVSDSKTKTMVAALIGDIKKDVRVGTYGIREPLEINEVNKNHIDLIIVPAVGFDKNCNRLGMGGGFYDKFMQGLKAFKVGICFENQIAQSISGEEHDVPVNVVITDEGEYKNEETKA